MKFSPLSIPEKSKKPTSFHAVFGCREARELGLSDASGQSREVICIPFNGGALLAPITSKINTLSYKGFTTEVCTNGKFFFGKLLHISQNIAWRSADAEKAEAAFHAVVDRFAELPFDR